MFQSPKIRFKNSESKETSLPSSSNDALYFAIQKMMRDSGCPEALLSRYHQRRLVLKNLHGIIRGKLDKEKRNYINLICEQNNLTPVYKHLGTGCWGCTFALADNTALKFTSDAREAKAAHILEGSKNNYITDFYKIRNFTINDEPTKYYLIHREKLNQAGSLKGHFKEAALLVSKATQNITQTGLHGSSSEVTHEHNDPAATAMTFSKELLIETNRHKIKIEDLHFDNLGIKNNHLCIFDLSLAKCPNVDVKKYEAPPFQFCKE